MAQFVQLWKSRRHVIDLLVNAAREADRAREREYSAAVSIQSWFRGCRLRAYLQYLSECATVIQKHYRGHLGRKLYQATLQEHVEEMRRSHYNAMAARIQSAWRGYYVRKYVFDYHAQQRYMSELQKKNEAVRERLALYQTILELERTARKEQLMELQAGEKARRQHYMLSTECREGIFKPYRDGKSEPLPFENRMKSLKFSLHPTRTFRPTKHRTVSCDSHMITFTTMPLPPISLPHKTQGPFCDPGTAWRQRHKPLNPTLRVATQFNSEESARAELRAREWRERVVEEKFLPFSHTSPHHYQPLLHSASSYLRPLYGTKRFRDEDSTRNIHKKDFQTVVPPVPVFDKLTSSY